MAQTPSTRTSTEQALTEQTPTSAPYGSWTSPIAAADLAASSHTVTGGAFVGDEVWWTELRSAEGGRYAVRRADADGQPTDVLPAPWNARTRVHEYGGGAWTVTDGNTLVFAEFTDQRLYALDAGGQPRPLTPADAGFRFAELQVAGERILAIRETHDGDQVARDIVLVPLDGRAAQDADEIVSIVSGSHFLACPRISPDGSKLAWIAWEHPQMPWDGTELRVGDLDETSRVTAWSTLIGSTTESVLQPEWLSGRSDALYSLSDRTGWWNVYRILLTGEITALRDEKADVGGPLWSLGSRWYEQLDDGRILTVSTFGNDSLSILDPDSGTYEPVDIPFTSIMLSGIAGTRVAVRCGSAQHAAGLRLLDLTGGISDIRLSDIRLSVDELPDAAYLPRAEAVTFQGPKREVHAFVYPPRNADFTGIPCELPPYIAFVHGGPTAHSQAEQNLRIAYFTSRGLGVVDVNYGGSTGYGREYRERLKGKWGIVDVEDTVAAVIGLADAGRADRGRLAITGGSAGGWTVLAALTGSDAFSAGTSYYGVGELTAFVQETHDFESRYIDGLVGPLPEAAELYETRAPLNNVDGLNAPVLLLQGLDDPVVPPSQAERFRDALVAKGLPHAYVTYEGESHGFRRAETIIHATEAELSFYGQVFGFTPIGVPVFKLWRP